MRIEDNKTSAINSSATGGTQRTRAAKQLSSLAADSASVAATNDAVQLSKIVDGMSAGKVTADHAISAERSARIEELTKQVQSGQYHPDPKKVADSLIREMLSGPASS